jgi:class 3 adenylate cyclase
MSKERDSFSKGRTYTDVYFLRIDASGHSSIVSSNPSDIVDKFFDHFESTVVDAVEQTRRLTGCSYAEFWGWQGDGGLCVLYDRNESVSQRTALQCAMDILDFRLQALQTALTRLSAKGEFHIRVAVHRGTFTYKGHGSLGSIHSKDLNFVAHLETVAPKDSLVISKEVCDRCPPDLAGKFWLLPFPFEGKEVALYSRRNRRDVGLEWIGCVPIAESVQINMLPRRYSETDKARIVQFAESEVVDLGTALSTCSQYLVSTARPAPYRDIVRSLTERGTKYICLVLHPDSDVAKDYAEARGELDLIDRIHTSITKMKQFADSLGTSKGYFELYLYRSLPHFAGIFVDRKAEGLLLFAPYLPHLGKILPIERADSLHLVVLPAVSPELFEQTDKYVDALLGDSQTEKII